MILPLRIRRTLKTLTTSRFLPADIGERYDTELKRSRPTTHPFSSRIQTDFSGCAILALNEALYHISGEQEQNGGGEERKLGENSSSGKPGRKCRPRSKNSLS